MPYQDITELPENVRSVLPEHAQEIYKEAFNHAWDEYKDPDKRRDGADREEVVHRVAWSAVKRKYEKGEDGQWHRTLNNALQIDRK
jgi:cation transport regulator